MKLVCLASELGIVRLGPADSVPQWAQRGCFQSVTRTTEELSIVCDSHDIPAEVAAERDWSCLCVAGRLDFALTGVLASLAEPLAKAGISIFVVSTYDTDYVLVRTRALADAVAALRNAGHDVSTA